MSETRPKVKRKTAPGTRPNDTAKARQPGSGRNKPAAGFDPQTKTWK